MYIANTLRSSVVLNWERTPHKYKYILREVLTAWFLISHLKICYFNSKVRIKEFLSNSPAATSKFPVID